MAAEVLVLIPSTVVGMSVVGVTIVAVTFMISITVVLPAWTLVERNALLLGIFRYILSFLECRPPWIEVARFANRTVLMQDPLIEILFTPVIRLQPPQSPSVSTPLLDIYFK